VVDVPDLSLPGDLKVFSRPSRIVRNQGESPPITRDVLTIRADLGWFGAGRDVDL